VPLEVTEGQGGKGSVVGTPDWPTQEWGEEMVRRRMVFTGRVRFMRKQKGSQGVFTYRGASEYELGSMGSNSSSFRLTTVEVSDRSNFLLKAQEAPDH
jgi:hypothetical protein